MKPFKPMQRLEQFIRARYTKWLDKRIPPQRELTLVQRNIFIYPIWQFVYYFILVMALWLAATNYENNLAFALAFLLLSIFLVCILHTYNNLAGLTITVIGAEPVFAGEYAEVELVLSTREGKWRNSLRLYWQKKHQVSVSLIKKINCRIKVPVKANQRGWFNPGRMTVDSIYPLGILRSVSYLDLDVKILVYPQPVCFMALSSESVGTGEIEGAGFKQGADEFSTLKEYEPGASLKQIAWKQYAKVGDLFLKEYGEYVSQQEWLEWDAFPGLGLEERLSTLCYWALHFNKQNKVYGLKLPGFTYEPDSGPLHFKKILGALALFGVDR